MRTRYVFALLLFVATACLTQGVQAKIQSEKQQGDKAAVDSAQDESEDVAPDKVAERLQEAKKELKALRDELADAQKKFTLKMRSARTLAAREEAVKANPMIELGPRFVDLAKKYEGTEEAYQALTTATSGGLDDAKTEAMEMLLALVEADPDSRKSDSALKLLASQESGKPKARAMGMLFAKTMADPDSAEAHKLYSMLAFTRGTDQSKTKAIEKLFASVEADPTTARSIEHLVNFATRGLGDEKAKATEILIEKHVNHEQIDKLMTGMARGLPSPNADKWLKTISEKATSPKIKINAIFNRLTLLDRIKSFKTFLDGADEERKKTFPAEVIAFVNVERDPNEVVDLEKMLEKFVKEQKGLLKRAESELFALQHLSVGKEAPEIVGLDLDGVGFNLSDYRGKVVFLDFWGDW